jgi:hypothetical protein
MVDSVNRVELNLNLKFQLPGWVRALEEGKRTSVHVNNRRTCANGLWWPSYLTSIHRDGKWLFDRHPLLSALL